MGLDLKSRYEFWYYVSVGAGLANATASFMMMAGLFELVRGLWVAVAIAGAGALCCMIASSVGEQASLFPGSSGIRTYLKASLGNQVSLFLVYNYLAFVVLVAGIESHLFGLVVNAAFPSFPPRAAAMTVLAATIVINLIGLEVPRVVQVVGTAILVLGIAAVGLGGLLLAPNLGILYRETFQGDGLRSALLLPAAIGMGFFLLVGFEWVTPLGFGPRAYERLIPRSMVTAIVVTIVINVLFVIGLAAQFARPAIVANPVPQIDLAVSLLGGGGRIASLFLCVLATLSTFNAGLLGGSRLIYSLAREGYFFKFCTAVSIRGVTYGATWLMGGICIAASLLVIHFGWEMVAAVIGSAIVCFVYASLVYSLIRLRRSRPDQKRAYRSSIPVGVYWALIVVLPMLGTVSLFATPGLGLRPVWGFLICVTVSSAMTKWFLYAKGAPGGQASLAVSR